MNGTGIATTRPSLPASPARGIGRLLEASERGLTQLEPPFPSLDYRELCGHSDTVRERSLEDAIALLAKFPSAEQERDRAAQISRAMKAGSDRKAIVGMVAMLIDAFPSGRPANPEAYLDTIVHDLLSLRYSPEVVALACRNIRRTSKFLPSVSEIMEAAENAYSHFETSRRHATNCADHIERATRNVAAVRQAVSRHPNENPENFSDAPR